MRTFSDGAMIASSWVGRALKETASTLDRTRSATFRRAVT